MARRVEQRLSRRPKSAPLAVIQISETNMIDVANTRQIRLERRSPSYWRVTFDHPPLNIFGPETIPRLNEIITAIEIDKHVRVVVFDSAVKGFFLTHYDLPARLDELASGPDWLAASSRYACTPQPRSSSLYRLDPRARDGGGKRAFAGERSPLRESRKSDLVAMGSWGRPGPGRRTDGATASPYRPRTCVGSAAWGRRYSRRSG